MRPRCQDLGAALHRLVDGELASGSALALRMHAAACPPCARRVDGARRVSAVLASMGSQAAVPPADLTARIMVSLPAASRPWTWRGKATLAAAAAIGLSTAGAVATRAVLSLGGAAGDPVLSGMRAALGSAGQWLGRFDALAQVLLGLLELPAGLSAGPSSPTLLPALALIAIGLLGATTALTLSAAPRLSTSRRVLS
jgi:anti-sigma factor (TIGR02949 family)